MFKNNKGVTLVVLMITVVIMMILMGGVIKTIFYVMYNLRAGRIVANMTLVQSKAETIYEEYKFYNNNTKYLIGNKVNKIDGHVDISQDEKNIIINNKNLTSDDISNWSWYSWDRNTLKSQGLDENMLAENEVFYVNYEYGEIIYSKGTSFDNENYLYSMTGLNYMLENN